MKKTILIITAVVLLLSLVSCKNSKMKEAQVGDTITFGTYEQDNNLDNGKEAIEWIVLAKEEGKMLVISKYALDCQQYYPSYSSVSWSDSFLRVWLNTDFFDEAFSEEEQKRIPAVTIENKDNETYRVDGGNLTNDNVFCLSFDEAKTYFKSDSDRKAQATQYAVESREARATEETKSCWWWLRSPGNTKRYASVVSRSGSIDDNGELINSDFIAIRPAMWVNIEG